MAVGRYFVVDTPSKKILLGPFKWDPVTDPDFTPGIPGTVITEAAAKSGGYTFPVTPPDPASVILTKFPAAIQANNTFRAIPSPTLAQTANYAQTAARELNAILRLLGQLLDDTSDT